MDGAETLNGELISFKGGGGGGSMEEEEELADPVDPVRLMRAFVKREYLKGG